MKKNLLFLSVLGLCTALTPALHAASSPPHPEPSAEETETLGTGNEATLFDLGAMDKAGGSCADGPAPQPLPDGGEGFAIPGEFLTVTDSDPCRAWDVPLVPNVKYNSITVEFDLDFDRWATPLFNNITSLRRAAASRKDRILYYGLILRGDKHKTVLDLGNDVLKRADGPWQEHNKYHVVLSANLGARKVTLNVYQDDQLVHALGGKITAREIRSVGQNLVRVDFSSPGIGDGAYYPLYGSTFSNLTVTAVRR